MTILEIERLIRKIADVLKPDGNGETASNFAGDYAAACHAANLRLQQCEGMIKAGDRPQAIQLAETTPNLLDTVTLLEFHSADEWRGFCQQNSLPVGERIDARAVQTLNECYAQGITSDHPLYAVYRRAVLQRNDEEALKTLQSIARLNPADTNAASELARLDAKVLAGKVTRLKDSLAVADRTRLVKEIEAIEAFGFKTRPEGETWRQAQAARCEWLLEETNRVKDRGRWSEALANLDFIRRLQDEFKMALPPEVVKERDALESWARNEKAKDKTEREFQALVSQLDQEIQASEEKDTSARYVELPELRDDFEAMNKTWRALTDFTRPIPEDAGASFRKRSGLLEGEIARRTSLRRRIIFGSTFALIVLIVGLAWLVLSAMKSREFSRQLQAAVAQREVRAADKLLDRAHQQKIVDAQSVAAAETFSAQEHALLANFENAFNQLPAQLTGTPSAPQLAILADQLTATRNALNALAPDLKAENEPRLQAFDQKWQDYLANSVTTVNNVLDQAVSAAEKESDDLDYRAPVEKTTAQLATLAVSVQKMEECQAGFGKTLQLRSDLLDRASAVRAKFATYKAELGKLDTGFEELKRARSTAEFSDAIKTITSSEFTTAPATAAAFGVQALGISDETMLRTLLNVTNAATWSYIQKTGPPHFTPELAMPAERRLLKELNDDPAVNGNHQHYRLWLDAEGNNKVDWITLDSFDGSTGWKQIKALTLSPTATSAVFEKRDYGWFNGQYKLSPTQAIYQLEALDAMDEASAYHAIGLEQVLTGETYAQTLLGVLDSLKDSRAGSPLFRAWLFMHVVDLMKLQPDSWGLTFCPAATLHEAQITAVTGGKLADGDWFAAARAQALRDKLERFFESVKPVSYARQAEGLLNLDRAVVKNGFQYAGFVGVDGRPNYTDTSATGEVWGYGAATKAPVLLAAGINASQPLKEPAMPLSPLFVLAQPAREYLKAAGVNPGDASFRGALPPLFTGAQP